MCCLRLRLLLPVTAAELRRRRAIACGVALGVALGVLRWAVQWWRRCSHALEPLGDRYVGMVGVGAIMSRAVISGLGLSG